MLEGILHSAPWLTRIILQEIHGRSVLLPGSEPRAPRTGAAMFFRMVPVISLLIPIGIALWRFGNAITLAVILPAWRLVKYFNGVTGELIGQSIRTKAGDNRAMESVQVIRN
jgi:hypothetical protein